MGFVAAIPQTPYSNYKGSVSNPYLFMLDPDSGLFWNPGLCQENGLS